ncbi:MAG: DUF455 family protein [Ktedonobacteraceae bacterium]|nr:DUF455 family protein [Ktedonobacteraceae bacterium]
MAQAYLDYKQVRPRTFLTVHTNAQRLAALYSLEVELTRLIGSWIPRTPEFPEKLTLGRMVYEDACHASLLEARFGELRVAQESRDLFRRRSVDGLLQLEHLDDAHAFLAALIRVVKPALLADYKRHLDASPPYVDEPTRRMLKHIIAEEKEQIEVGMALLADRGIGWSAYQEIETQIRAGLWHLNGTDSAMKQGAFVGAQPLLLPAPIWPAAVRQLVADEPSPEYPSDFEQAMQRCIHDLVFSETEALDIFGRYVYEFHDVPWEFTLEAARLCWDEARHVELLLNVLERYKGYIGQFPAKAPGYEEYIQQPTLLDKLLVVNVLAEGEVSTDTQTQHREAFLQLGDDLSALFKDYEMADEVNHGRFGIKWAQWLVEQTGADYAEALQHAREALQALKGQHQAKSQQSPIPLVRLGLDETSDKRTVNITAKRLVGFTQQEIDALSAQASQLLTEDEA